MRRNKRVCRSGRRAIAATLLLATLGASGAVATAWDSGQEPRVYCDASQKGSVSRGRIYAVQFFTNGSPRAERSYDCTVRSPPSLPLKPEYKGVTTCNCVSVKEGTGYLLSGADSSESLFMSTDAGEICAHAYGKLGIRAVPKP